MDDSSLSRRSFLKATGGAAATAAVAGCTSIGGGDEPEGTLVYARGSHSATLDPQQTTSGEDVKVSNQIFDSLIRFTPGGGGSLEAGLATEYELSGTTASLTLREDVTFHNGEDFTAEDFKATYQRFVDEDYEYYLGENASAYGPFTLGSWVESVNVVDDHELELELTQQYAPFLRNLAMFAANVLSKAQIEDLGSGAENQAQLGEEPVGTSAFELDDLDDSNEKILLTANTDYWGDGPNVGKIVFNTIGSNSTRASSVINGESHIIDGIGAQASQQLDDSDTASLASKDGINIGYMAFNMARFEPFREKEVRQAISYAIDTEAIVNNIYEGFASQADQPIPPNVLGYNDDLDPYPADKDKAQSMLEDAGYGDGFSFELSTFKNPRGYNPSPIETAEQVRSDLGEIGIEVEINQMSFSPFLDYTLTGKHDACFLGWYTDNADPDNFFYALLHPQVDVEEVPSGQDWVSWDTEGLNGLDVAAWANTEYMEKVEEGQKTYDEGERESLYKEASQMAHEEAPWVFIDYAKTLRGVHESVDSDSYKVSSIGGPYLELVELTE